MYKCLVTGKTFSNTKLKQSAFSGDSLPCCPHCGDSPWAYDRYTLAHDKCSENEVSNPNPVTREEKLLNFTALVIEDCGYNENNKEYAIQYGTQHCCFSKSKATQLVEQKLNELGCVTEDNDSSEEIDMDLVVNRAIAIGKLKGASQETVVNTICMLLDGVVKHNVAVVVNYRWDKV